MFFLYLVPTKPPANIDANILDKFVEISWNPVPEESRNGKILGYRITYYQARNHTYQQTETKPHDFFSVQLKSLDKFTEYHVKILAYTRAGNGKVDYISFNTSDDSKYQHRNSPYCVPFSSYHSLWENIVFKDLSKRTRKKTQVENLGLLAIPFGKDLCALALTCAHFSRDQIYARKSTQVE